MPKSKKAGSKVSPQGIEMMRGAEAVARRRSSKTTERLPPEWRFIEKEDYSCSSEQKRHLLEYELAREAVARGLPYRSTATWRAIFNDEFPDKPFLSIDPARRWNLIKAAFSKDGGVVPLFDYAKEWSGISFQFRYALLPEYQARLEEIAGEREESTSDTASNFLASLPATAYDESIAHVRMTVRFDYSDDDLKVAFAEMLASMRRADSIPGRKDEVDAHLKRLAAARLHRIFGTVKAAQDYLSDCKCDFPYKHEAGWSQASKAVDGWLSVKQRQKIN